MEHDQKILKKIKKKLWRGRSTRVFLGEWRAGGAGREKEGMETTHGTYLGRGKGAKARLPDKPSLKNPQQSCFSRPSWGGGFGWEKERRSQKGVKEGVGVGGGGTPRKGSSCSNRANVLGWGSLKDFSLHVELNRVAS